METAYLGLHKKYLTCHTYSWSQAATQKLTFNFSQDSLSIYLPFSEPALLREEGWTGPDTPSPGMLTCFHLPRWWPQSCSPAGLLCGVQATCNHQLPTRQVMRASHRHPRSTWVRPSPPPPHQEAMFVLNLGSSGKCTLNENGGSCSVLSA